MEGKRATDEHVGATAIAVAPFPDQAQWVEVLSALAGERGRVRALASLDDLASLGAGGGRLILDVDHVATEDIGWVRRILAALPGWRLVCTGRDAAARNARALLRDGTARWLPAPPALDELQALVPRAPAKVVPTPATAAAAPAASAPAGDTLGRDQVAMLADISQRLELSFAVLREHGRLSDADLEPSSIELRRLLRFTRTLSCLLSPPPRGDEEFDLAALIDEQLAALTLRARKGPRFQPRTSPEGRGVEFFVRADRAAVALAFETLLQFARLCAGQGETVRVVYTPQGASELLVSVEFPAGPLAGLGAEQLSDPQVLRERLPEIGANDLAAASAILTSQGGGLEVHGNGNGQLLLHARLPLERRGAPAPASAPPRASAPRQRATGDDPFA